MSKRTELGNWVKSIRLSRGLSQAEMAEKLGMGSSQALANIESGSLSIPVKRVKRFAQVFGVSHAEIIDRMVSDHRVRLEERVRAT